MGTKRTLRRIGIGIVVGVLAGVSRAQQTGDCYTTVHDARKTPAEEGTHIVQDVTLGNTFHAYTLRYEAIEPPDEPNRIVPRKWAHTIGYTPVGIAAPSMACWYNQGFMLWTLDDVNLKDFRPTMRVLRASGSDVAVSYSWDTPKAVVTAVFAVAERNDKLIMFGRIEPKAEIESVKLRLMAYPATFSKPWNRTVTTAVRTLEAGSAALDLEKERWVLLEDVTEGRSGDGPAGLLLGDTGAFDRASVTGIGGYAEYVDLELAAGRTSFVLGFYEMPEQPDVESVRRDFRAGADVESDALAKLVDVDLTEPLPAIPAGDPERIARILAEREEREKALLSRPAERWAPREEPLSFGWLRQAPGEPVHVALLCPRWAAFETMELARRVRLDVAHQYFDSATEIATPGSWPYVRQTGIGTLGVGLATKNALRICADPSRDVILVAGLAARALPERVMETILRQVRDNGKALLLSGGSSVLEGWPDELTAQPDTAVADAVRAAFMTWENVPGLQPGERGRVGDAFPLSGYRYGRGRVLLWQANIGRYSAFVPLSDRVEGLDGAADRVCAMNAFGLWRLADRAAPPLSLTVSDTSGGLMPKLSGAAVGAALTDIAAEVVVRVQDDLDRVVAERNVPSDQFFGSGVPLPVQPAGRSYFADALVLGSRGEVLACGSTSFSVSSSERIDSVRLSPAVTIHPAAVPAVSLGEGGELSCAAVVAGLQGGGYALRWTISDALGRVLGQTESRVGGPGDVQVAVRIPRPVTVCHHADIVLLKDGNEVVHRRQRFTIPLDYPTDDFTYLMWSYARGEPVTRRVQRLCYDLGADMMDLCHMRGYTDEGAAREYAVAAQSGLRVLPYVTRIANTTGPGGVLKPGLFDREWIERQDESITICTRQAVPYRPPAYTLGDENYLARRGGEFGNGEDSMKAFRGWLRETYGTIAALNAAWGTTHGSFEDISAPVGLADAAADSGSYVAWFDHRRFFDEAFADLHEHFAAVIRQIDPGSRVGWDGFLGYTWQSGYNFYLLTRNLDLNQTYTTHPFQGELVRAFAGADSLRGEWGNAIADNEAGFRAISWLNLFRQHNSCWWWTSWGCDYIPFNPDTSVSAMGRWFFDEAAFLRSGVGKLLLHAERDNSEVAVLYNQTDLFAAHLAGAVCGKDTAFAPDSRWTANHRGVIRVLKELGVQFDYVAAEELGTDPDALDCRVLVLPLATCLSDTAAERIRTFAEAGGLVVADGRTGLLDGNGALREHRALAETLGVDSGTDAEAFGVASGRAELSLDGDTFEVPVLEPGLAVNAPAHHRKAGEYAVLVGNAPGKGRALTLNIPFEHIGDLCLDGRAEPFLAILRAAFERAGVRPFSELAGTDGKPVHRVEQVVFRDGALTYFGLLQDIMWRVDTSRELTVKRAKAAYVYDSREGSLLSAEPLDSWTVTVSRGEPALFSLLPYRVTGVELRGGAPSVRPGEELTLDMAVRTVEGAAGHHVVHVAVFGPGSEAEHRQYSMNVDCPGGRGKAVIPFALNDRPGQWTIRCRDAATGATAEHAVQVSAP